MNRSSFSACKLWWISALNRRTLSSPTFKKQPKEPSNKPLCYFLWIKPVKIVASISSSPRSWQQMRKATSLSSRIRARRIPTISSVSLSLNPLWKACKFRLSSYWLVKDKPTQENRTAQRMCRPSSLTSRALKWMLEGHSKSNRDTTSSNAKVHQSTSDLEAFRKYLNATVIRSSSKACRYIGLV